MTTHTDKHKDLPQPPDHLSLLRQHIKHAADELSRQSEQVSESELGSLIYLGNIHDSFPRELITDPVLNSDEVRSWMLMRLEVKDQHSVARIPNLDALMEKLKCSRINVSVNMQVLRAMRWITLCAEVKGADSQYRGAVYIQHDTPLSLAETLQLDPSYLNFLNHVESGSAFSRINEIKQAVLKHTNFRLMSDRDVLIPETNLNQSIERLTQNDTSEQGVFTRKACPFEVIDPNWEVNYYENSAIHPEIREALRDKTNDEAHVKNPYSDGQNSYDPGIIDLRIEQESTSGVNREKHVDTGVNPAHVKIPYSVSLSCSSSNIYNNKNTTTTTTSSQIRLKVPECLSYSPAMRDFAYDIALRLPEEQQQYALNYVEDAYIAGREGRGKPIGNSIQYLKKIVSLIQSGKLEPSSFGFREPEKREESKPSLKPNTNKAKKRELSLEIAHLDKMIQHAPESSKPLLMAQKEEVEAKLALLN